MTMNSKYTDLMIRPSRCIDTKIVWYGKGNTCGSMSTSHGSSEIGSLYVSLAMQNCDFACGSGDGYGSGDGDRYGKTWRLQ